MKSRNQIYSGTFLMLVFIFCASFFFLFLINVLTDNKNISDVFIFSSVVSTFFSSIYYTKLRNKYKKEMLEILTIMLNHTELFELGLCRWAFSLYQYGYISDRKYQLIMEYLKHKRPKHLDEYQMYWWTPGTIRPRIRWIREQIDELN